MSGAIFVCFEGVEGSGKTSQAELLHARLWAEGIQATLVREPGSTPLGRHLRDYLKSRQPLSKEAELLLFEAARAELVHSEIRPSLAKGLTVIADRFGASSLAYQGYGRKIDLAVIEYLNRFATQGLDPAITFLLDLDPAAGLRRVGEPQMVLPLYPDSTAQPVRPDVAGHRRFEDQPLAFHQRIRQGYLALARANQEGWVIIDAALPSSEIEVEVWDHVSRRLGRLPSPSL